MSPSTQENFGLRDHFGLFGGGAVCIVISWKTYPIIRWASYMRRVCENNFSISQDSLDLHTCGGVLLPCTYRILTGDSIINSAASMVAPATS